MGRSITLTGKDGFVLGAYLAEPQGAARGGVVICQEIFGVTEYLKSVCDFYAGAGYDEAIAKLARERTLEFLRRHVG